MHLNLDSLGQNVYSTCVCAHDVTVSLFQRQKENITLHSKEGRLWNIYADHFSKEGREETPYWK